MKYFKNIYELPPIDHWDGSLDVSEMYGDKADAVIDEVKELVKELSDEYPHTIKCGIVGNPCNFNFETVVYAKIVNNGTVYAFTNADLLTDITKVDGDMWKSQFFRYPWIDYQEYISSPEWKKKADKIKQRDKKCLCCGRKNNLQVHHLTYVNLGHEDAKDLITLCDDCHIWIEKVKEAFKQQAGYKMPERMQIDYLLERKRRKEGEWETF